MGQMRQRIEKSAVNRHTPRSVLRFMGRQLYAVLGPSSGAVDGELALVGVASISFCSSSYSSG